MSKGYTLRELHKTHGTEAFLRRMFEGVTRKEEPWVLVENSDQVKNGFTLKDLWFALTGRESAGSGLRLGNQDPDIFKRVLEGLTPGGLREDVASTAFAIITGNTMQRYYIDAFNEVERIGPSLADDYPSKLKIDTITGFETMDLTKHEIPEGADYPDFGISDKYVTYPEPGKIGGIVRVTEETIYFDQTGQILSAVKKLGDRMATYQEFLDVGDVFDAFYVASTKGVYRVSGSVTELYPTGGTLNNYVSGATTVLDLTNGVTALRAARNQFKNMTDDSNDSFPILSSPKSILIGDVDVDIVDTLLNSAGDPGSANLRKNPLQNPRHRYEVLASQMVDYFRASTTYTRVPTYGWLMGSFKKQFDRKVIFPSETFVSQGPDSDDAIQKDVVFRFKTRYKGRIYAKDHRYVVFVKGAA